ncbi:MAG: 2-hydroxyacid dehydrogenase [Planctomycetota bacterium]|jgi:glyoxylate reductase
MPRIAVTRPVPEETLHALRAFELTEVGPGIDALLCTLEDDVDRALLESLAPNLKVVANFAVGVDNIDLEAARELGIVVTNTPDVLTDATAEVAIGLMLACARRFLQGDQVMRAGRFEGWAPLYHLGHAIYGKTVGIVGAGRIGQRVGETMRKGFDCEVIFHRPTDLDELIAQSDFVSLHCPLNDKTRHLIDAARLERMKPTAILINTARGPVVDEIALTEALRTGSIAGAGLDVFENEPRTAPGLTELDNVVLLPHIGSATHETRAAMGRLAAEGILAVLSGQEPKHRVV